jgi:NitT/TauT family transport system substrate-binding protein
MYYKKIFCFLFLSFLFVSSSCENKTVSEPTVSQTISTSPATAPETALAETETVAGIRIGALKGPTAMGMAGMDREIQIFNSPDEIVPLIVKGELDIAAAPSNLSSVLYNNANKSVSVLAINTLGVLYVVETGESVKSVADLEGKTIYSSGKGATPEFALNYILEKNGVTANVEYKTEHSEIAALLAQNPERIALLPEPFVTVAQTQNPNLRKALDFNEEWEKVGDGSALVMGVVIARNEFIQNGDVEGFLEDYRASVDFVNSDVESAAKKIAALDIVPEPVAQKALPFCNIVLITGDELKEKLEGYLKIAFGQNPESIGGALPGEDFYY